MALRVWVCSIDDVIDNQLRAFAVRGVTWPVLVTRIDGELIACPGVCPHEDVALADGVLAGWELTCPGHGWGFDLRSGRCRHAPGLELRRYPITLIDGELWVDLL